MVAEVYAFILNQQKITQRLVRCVSAGKETCFESTLSTNDRHLVTGFNCPSQRDDRLIESLVAVRLTNGPFYI